MKNHALLSILLLLVILLACHKVEEENGETTPQLPPNFILNSLGNSILTNTPFKVQGKRIPPETVIKPKRIPILRQPETVRIPTNKLRAKTPKTIPLRAPLPSIQLGQQGYLSARKIKVERTVLPAHQPKPVPASSPKIQKDTKFDIQSFNIEQGLKSAEIQSLCIDSRNFLWLGNSRGGISRFDGNNFLHYGTKEGLLDSHIFTIAEDDLGRLWLGAFAHSLTCYDGKNFIRYTFPGLDFGAIQTIFKDPIGHMWFGFGTNNGILHFDGHDFTHFSFSDKKTDSIVYDIEGDAEGNLWLATYGSGVIKFTPSTRGFIRYTQKEGLTSDDVFCILKRKNGEFWFGTEGGVTQFNGREFKQYTKESGLQGQKISSLYEDAYGDLWLGGIVDGLSKFDGRHFSHYREKEGLPDDQIRGLVGDQNGLLWIATHGGGLARFNTRGVETLTIKDGLKINDLSSIIEDRNHNYWLTYGKYGTSGHGISKMTDTTLTHYSIPEGLTSLHTRSILEDHKGGLWIATNSGGVNYFDGESFTEYSQEQGMGYQHLWYTYEDRQYGLWFANGGSGVTYFNGEQFTQYREEEGMSCRFAMFILQDDKDNMWFATWGGGITRFDGSNFTHFTENEGLGSNFVYTMLIDHQNRLWVGTEAGGISIYDLENPQKGFTSFTEEQSLSDNTIWKIIEDSLHRIWVSTEKGIDLFIPIDSSREEQLVPDLLNYQRYFFSKLDGIKSFPYLRNSGYLDSKNQLWFGGVNGLSKIDLNRFVIPNTAPINLQLSHVEIQQRFIDFRKLSNPIYQNSFDFGSVLSQSFDSIVTFHNYPTGLSLPYRINHLTFHVSATDWNAPHKIQYRYKIDELDQDWSIPQSDTRIDYRNLRSGHFTLQVQAQGEAQIWSAPISYTFTIKPPWWKTWWAYCLYLLALAFIAYSLYQFLLHRQLAIAEAQRLQELDLVKSRLYTNITHEFRTPLTVISGMASQVLDNPKDWFREGLTMIERNSRHLLHLVNQLLDLSQIEAGRLTLDLIQSDIVAYLSYLTESFHSYAETKDIRLHLLPEIDELYMDFDPHQIQSIFSNLISNAIKFTGPGEDVYIKIKKQEQASGEQICYISITDTGLGIAADQIPHIFDRFYQTDSSSTRKSEGTGIGLALVKELIHLLGGKIEVDSQEDKGTTFMIWLPIEQKAQRGYTITSPNPALLPNPSPPPIESTTTDHQNIDPSLPLVLLIEDNEDVLQYLASCLNNQYRLEKALNGQIGIEKAIQLIPDIIISDVMMPEKDGFEVLATLKEHPLTSHIPIILLTAKADIASRLQGFEHGADAYLPKPFDKVELVIRMRKMIELRQKIQTHFHSLSGPKDETEESLQKESLFLLNVRKAVENNLGDETFGIAELCSELAISRTQLHRKLKALTGQSTSLVIRSIRLEKAKQLLTTSSLNISEVGYATGFINNSYFSQVFTKEFGTSPSQYQKEAQG